MPISQESSRNLYIAWGPPFNGRGFPHMAKSGSHHFPFEANRRDGVPHVITGVSFNSRPIDASQMAVEDRHISNTASTPGNLSDAITIKMYEIA